MDWTYRLRLRNLQMLLSLAQTGNMSQSAEALHTTQPGLSKWLRELEADIGVPLFERLARGLRPTQDGEVLIEHARRIEAHLDTARDEMTVRRMGGDGLVTIGFAGTSSVDTVPMSVLRILEKIPTAHIRLLENKSDVLIESLSAGLLDVVVGPSDMPSLDPDIRSEVLYVEPIHLVARKDHPVLSIPDPVWDDVLSYPWALWAKGSSVRTVFDKAIAEAGQKLPATYVESNSATLTTTLLVNSDMIGVTSHRPALRWTRMNILAIIPLELAVAGSVTLYWRSDSSSRLAVKAALEAIREVVQQFAQEN